MERKMEGPCSVTERVDTNACVRRPSTLESSRPGHGAMREQPWWSAWATQPFVRWSNTLAASKPPMRCHSRSNGRGNIRAKAGAAHFGGKGGDTIGTKEMINPVLSTCVPSL